MIVATPIEKEKRGWACYEVAARAWFASQDRERRMAIAMAGRSLVCPRQGRGAKKMRWNEEGQNGPRGERRVGREWSQIAARDKPARAQLINFPPGTQSLPHPPLILACALEPGFHPSGQPRPLPGRREPPALVASPLPLVTLREPRSPCRAIISFDSSVFASARFVPFPFSLFCLDCPGMAPWICCRE